MTKRFLYHEDKIWWSKKFDDEQMERFNQMELGGELGYDLLEYLLCDIGVLDYSNYGPQSSPTINALHDTEKPQVYAIIPSAPGLVGKDLQNKGIFGDISIDYSPDIERMIYDSIWFEKGHYRKICLMESDFDDPALVRDTMDALHVKAVIRSDFVLEGREVAKSLPHLEY
ncbi:MAG: hypothetical protein J6T47_08745, partial [Lachnospiraceae bacterium]|nr:hypothetical protein [Lachnospiraceae bacterium]